MVGDQLVTHCDPRDNKVNLILHDLMSPRNKWSPWLHLLALKATAEANNLAAVAAAKDLYNKKMEEVGENIFFF